jgi:translation initiation factor IF-2
MITVTEFNAILLKQAKQHLATLKKAAPQPAPEPEPPPSPTVAVEASASPEPGEAPPTPASAPVAQSPVAALAEHLKVDENRAARLVDALGVVGNRLDRVRVVRVVKAEGAPANASKVGEFGYIVDLVGPPPTARGRDDRNDRDGRRGDRGGRGRPGGGRPGGGRPGGGFPGGGRGRPA